MNCTSDARPSLCNDRCCSLNRLSSRASGANRFSAFRTVLGSVVLPSFQAGAPDERLEVVDEAQKFTFGLQTRESELWHKVYGWKV